MSISNLIA